MSELLTESFCERCGTRYTFESGEPESKRAGLKKARVIARGLKNFVMSDDVSMDTAMTEARRDEERGLTALQLEAFHETFNFCMECRQYTCRDCWNEAEGRCLSCAPAPGHIELALYPEAYDEVDSGDRLAALLSGGAAATAAGPEQAPFEASPPAPFPDLAPAELAPAMAPPPVLRPYTLDRHAAGNGTVAPEPVIIEPAEAEPIAAEAEPIEAPFLAEEEQIAVAADAGSLEAALLAASATAPLAEPPLEPEPVVAVEPSLAPDALEPEPVQEPEPVVAIEPIPDASRPSPPVVIPFGHAGPQPAMPAVPAPAAAAAEPAALPAAAVAGGTLPGWDMVAPDQGRATPNAPLPLPAVVREVQPAPWFAARASSSVWEVSSAQVVERPGSGIQACVSCGLPLSASAHFCRRCGTRQAA